MAAKKPYEYRFIMTTEDDGLHEYVLGKVLHRKSGDVFRTHECEWGKESTEYPIEQTRKERELSDKEKTDILVDWNIPDLDGNRKYTRIADLTKDLREILYGDTK